MSIQDRQNRLESLAKLSAMGLLYRRAKWIHYIGMALILLVAILGVAASISENQDFSRFVPFIVLVMWFVDQEILKRKENALKTQAATIQEDFDCSVLELPWPEYKGICRPTSGDVERLASKAETKQGAAEKLKNWYTLGSIPSDSLLAKVHCQRMNCSWDMKLRKRWIMVLKIAFWSIAVLALLFAIATEITVTKLIALAASGIRALAWGMGEINAQSMAMKNIERIRRYLSGFSKERRPSPSDIRSVQDEIFEHRRSNPPIPNWFYRWNRDAQESEAANP